MTSGGAVFFLEVRKARTPSLRCWLEPAVASSGEGRGAVFFVSGVKVTVSFRFCLDDSGELLWHCEQKFLSEVSLVEFYCSMGCDTFICHTPATFPMEPVCTPAEFGAGGFLEAHFFTLCLPVSLVPFLNSNLTREHVGSLRWVG